MTEQNKQSDTPAPETHLLRTVRTFVMAIRAEAKGKDAIRFEHCDEILTGLDSALGIVRPSGPDTSPVETPSPEDHVDGAELLATVKEFARWHHLNEMTIYTGGKPSDSEIDFEASAWNTIEHAIAAKTSEDTR